MARPGSRGWPRCSDAVTRVDYGSRLGGVSSHGWIVFDARAEPGARCRGAVTRVDCLVCGDTVTQCREASRLECGSVSDRPGEQRDAWPRGVMNAAKPRVLLFGLIIERRRVGGTSVPRGSAAPGARDASRVTVNAGSCLTVSIPDRVIALLASPAPWWTRGRAWLPSASRRVNALLCSPASRRHGVLLGGSTVRRRCASASWWARGLDGRNLVTEVDDLTVTVDAYGRRARTGQFGRHGDRGTGCHPGRGAGGAPSRWLRGREDSSPVSAKRFCRHAGDGCRGAGPLTAVGSHYLHEK